MVLRFKYVELMDKSLDLGPKIKEAFGTHGCGACLVSDIPNYIQLRQQLLPLSYQLANLPKDQLIQLERPEAYYSKGWSCGVEKFKGQQDSSKGSYYANLSCDEQEKLNDEQIKIVGVEGMKIRIPNVWCQQIPALEQAYKDLGKLMIHVGQLLAYHIDRYVSTQCPTYKMGTIERFIREGDQHTGRLLHYYSQDPNKVNQWCGWHNDHSALTALTAPMYMTKNGTPLEDFVDVSGGLIAKNRFADQIKLEIPNDLLAFQIGETIQIVTGGIIEATPHCVVGGTECRNQNLNRNTFAVFMSPKFDEILNVPSSINPEEAMSRDAYNVPALQDRWRENITYQEYNVNSLRAYSE